MDPPSISIRHGPIIEAFPSRASAWVPKATRIVVHGEHTFTCVRKDDNKLKRIVGVNVKDPTARWAGVVDQLRTSRTDAQLRWMKVQAQAEDPMCETFVETRELSAEEMRHWRPNMPPYLLVKVPGEVTPGEEHLMYMLTAASSAENVWIEITEGNISWLRRAYVSNIFRPKARAPAKRNPVLRNLRGVVPDVKWCNSKKMLYTTYVDEKGKSRHLSKRISDTSDDERRVQKIQRRASTLQMMKDANSSAPLPEDDEDMMGTEGSDANISSGHSPEVIEGFDAPATATAPTTASSSGTSGGPQMGGRVLETRHGLVPPSWGRGEQHPVAPALIDTENPERSTAGEVATPHIKAEIDAYGGDTQVDSIAHEGIINVDTPSESD